MNASPSRLLALVALLTLGACVGRTGPHADRNGRSSDRTGSDELPIAPPLTGEPIILPGRGMLDGESAGNSSGASGGENSDKKKRRKVDETDDMFREKFNAARDAQMQGEDEAALTLIAAALDMNPKSPWDQRFKALKTDIKARHVSVDILRIDVRPLKDYIGFDEDVDLLIRIKNVGVSDVTVRPPDGKGPGALSGATLILTMRRTDRDIYEAELSHSWTQTVPLLSADSNELRIPPDGIHEIRVRVPAEEVGHEIAGMKVLDLSGELRAGGIQSGIEEPFGRVPIRAGRVVALPANYEPIAADPLGSLSKAVDALAPVHVLVATEFLAVEDRPMAIGILARSLSTSPIEMRAATLNALDLVRRAAAGTLLRPLAAPLMEALSAHPERESDLMEALHVLTMVANPPDVRLWQEWWRREQAGPGARVVADDQSPVKTVVGPKATDAKPTFTDPSRGGASPAAPPSKK